MHQFGPDEIKVSVVVPAFNMELFIEECLRSLFEQTVDRLEVIVVDDGSTDRTREVVESLDTARREVAQADFKAERRSFFRQERRNEAGAGALDGVCGRRRLGGQHDVLCSYRGG